MPWAERAVALARESGDPHALLFALTALGLASVFGQAGASQAEVEEAVRLAEATGNWSQLAFASAGSAMTSARTDPDRSAALLDRAADAAQRSGNPSTIAFITIMVGRVQGFHDRLDEARRSFGESIAANQALGDRRGVLVARSDLAHVLRRGRAFEEAEALYRETILEWRHLGQRGAIANQLESFAFLAHARAEPRRAAVLLGAADRLRVDAGASMADYERPEYEQETTEVRAALAPDAFDSAWAEGQSLSTDEAVDLARTG